ncbi:MAG: hypothetical protein NT007_01295 [Candidatus Kapabacteria bacterium]|nr:hypothetical protein [Candidatus Kapabacteria bacterium]
MKIKDKEVQVYDNGGTSADRYTIVIDGSVYAMNSSPFHPAYGISQYCGEEMEGYIPNEHWGVEVHDINELNEDTIKAIIQRFED